VTIVFNLTLAVLDLLALLRVARAKTAGKWLLIMPGVMLAGAILAGGFARDHFDFFRLAAYVVFLHGFLLSAGSALVFCSANKRVAVFSGAAAAVIPLAAYYAFLIEPYWLEVTHWQIASPKIERRFRIVVLADLQTDHFAGYERGVLRRVLEEKPDLILLAGDYIQAPFEKYRAIAKQTNAFMREISFGAPYGVYAVQGNVDPPSDWHEIFTGLDVTIVDRRETFDLGKLRLTCLGLDESYYTGAKVENAEPDKFHLVLGHAPNFALGRIEGDLLVAGHTHGGQVRLPFFGPIITHSRVPYRWASGLTTLPGGAKLLVSRGAGMERGYAPRMRFLCRPELIVIDLMPERE
jgi:predicted MPP superfamily phosphohydrolase